MKKNNCFIVRLLYCFRAIFCLLLTSYFLLLTNAPPAIAQEPETWNIINSNCIAEGDVATIQGFECMFVNIVRVLVPLAGLALFIMLIVGSFQMLTAGGEAKSIQKARKTLTSAIFGLVLFLGIWFILLLIKQITGVNVTKFEIPK